MIIDFINKYIDDNIFATEKKYAIFGAGGFGKDVLQLIMSKCNLNKMICFIDNNKAKSGSKVDGYPVFTLEELLDKTNMNDVRIIVASQYSNEIIEQLKSNNITDYAEVNYNIIRLLKDKNNIMEVLKCLEDEKSILVFNNLLKYRITKQQKYIYQINEENQYFPKDIIQISEDEVFIDGGAYIGDTIEDFMNVSCGKFKQMYSFEPSDGNFNKLSDYVKKLNDNRITIFKKGLYKENTVLHFRDDSDAGSGIYDDGIEKIETVSIDSIADTIINPTFIKMDIEGSELDALEGAKNIIQKFKPKLAICVYHKFDDMWKIPKYIKSIRDDYKIYMRHHDTNEWETVCYCI